MGRATIIKSAVIRNLKRAGIGPNDVLDEQIYDELLNGQNHIISETNPDAKITIVLQDEKSEYELATGDVVHDRSNVVSVKVAKRPASFLNNTFEIVSTREFVERVNRSITTTGQPIMGTIRDRKLEVWPVPDNDMDGEEIILYVYLSSSQAIEISDTEDPELAPEWDKALEYYATAQFLDSPQKDNYDARFERELNRLKGTVHRKSKNMQAPSVW